MFKDLPEGQTHSYDLKHCKICNQMTNHLNGVCQKCSSSLKLCQRCNGWHEGIHVCISDETFIKKMKTNFLQVGRTQQCGHCHPVEFGEGLKTMMKIYPDYVCDCVCHDKKAPERACAREDEF